MYYGIFFATFLIPLVGTLLFAGGQEAVRRSLRPLIAGAGLAALSSRRSPFLTWRHDRPSVNGRFGKSASTAPRPRTI